MTPQQRLTSRCCAFVVGVLMLAHGVSIGWTLLVLALMLAVDHTAAKV